MIRTIMASAATIALTMGVAVGQGLPPATGLTPGAPLGADPYSGEGVVAGETNPGVRGDGLERPADPALTADEPVMAAPVVSEPVVGEAVVAEPVPEQGVVVSAAPAAPVAANDQYVPSSIGLTPGAPLGSDPLSDQKLVAGEAFRSGNAGTLFR